MENEFTVTTPIECPVLLSLCESLSLYKDALSAPRSDLYWRNLKLAQLAFVIRSDEVQAALGDPVGSEIRQRLDLERQSLERLLSLDPQEFDEAPSAQVASDPSLDCPDQDEPVQ